MIKNHFRYFLALCLLCTGVLSSQGAWAGAWASYSAKIAPLFEAENKRLDRVHHPEKETELGFTLELKQSGEIREVKIITSSGSEKLDAIAMQSAFDLSPLPTPPASVFFRQFFTPLTLRYKFNPRKLAVVAPSGNMVERRQGFDDEKSGKPKNQSNPIRSKRSDLVASLQTELAQAGFDPGPVDGYFGRRTESAIRNFQRQSGLPVDGKPTNDLLLLLHDYSSTEGPSASSSAVSASGVAASSSTNTAVEAGSGRLSKKVYEDYEYIDPSIPKVYEDYEYIDQ